MQLQIDPALDAHGHDLLHIARPRAKSQPIERLHCPLLLVGSRLGCLVFFLREQLRNDAGEAQAQQDQR